MKQTILTNEKVSNAYRDLAVAFFFFFTLITLGRGILKEVFGTGYIMYFAPLFAPTMLLVFILAIRIIVKLKTDKRIINTVIALMVISIIFRATAVFFIYTDKLALPLNLTSAFLIAFVLVIIVYNLSLNLFLATNSFVEKLWAAICIFFVIGAVFGTIFSIFLMFDHGSLGIEMTHPLEIYIYSMIHSINIISGFDPIYQDTSENIRMTGILESLISTLFLVILIGRLLGGIGKGEHIERSDPQT